MARVRVMYWKEIPAQVQAQDDDGQVSSPLDNRFQDGIDAISMFDGSSGTDDYLMGWQWGAYAKSEGNAREAAEHAAKRLNENFPLNFVARIRDLHRSGERRPEPGAIDHWTDHDTT